jgi:hypothetical protein
VWSSQVAGGRPGHSLTFGITGLPRSLRFQTVLEAPTALSHLDLRANPGASQMCARIKSHTYDDSWYRNQCHIFII